MIYLDHAATTPVNPLALQAAWPWLTSEFGNPSSTYELGSRASVALEEARASAARFFSAKSSEIIFTSGGTESDNLAIIGIALANPRGRHIVSAKTEHLAVLESLEFLHRAHGFEISWLDLDKHGNIIDFQSSLRADTTLVTLMLANNEIGTIHPIRDLVLQAHQVGAKFHTDAVQAVGWADLNVQNLSVDALSVSGHKFGAPKGSGLLYLKSGIQTEPLLHGGGQENGLRSGTENVAWAVAIAAALEQVTHSGAASNFGPGSDSERVSKMRDEFIGNVLKNVPSARLTGDALHRMPNLASFTLAGVSGEAVLLELERRDVIVSSGSACAAGSSDPSHVLIAIGVNPELAQTAVRFSFSHETTTEELALANTALVESMANFT